jgi:hypothetical protein
VLHDQGPAVRVAAILSLLRDLADEIVVAVDSRVDPDTLGPLVAVADRVVRYRFRPPVDRPRAWLMAQCTGDWILSLDGDEVPSAALLAELPGMLRDTSVLQHHLPRRWLFPDPGQWLAELPWWPDHQVRWSATSPGQRGPLGRPRRDRGGAAQPPGRGAALTTSTACSPPRTSAPTRRPATTRPALATGRSAADRSTTCSTGRSGRTPARRSPSPPRTGR